MGLSDSNNNKTKPAPVSKQCVAGFVLACVGAAAATADIIIRKKNGKNISRTREHSLPAMCL